MRSGMRLYHVPTLRHSIAVARRAPGRPGLLLDMKTNPSHAPRLMRAVSRELRRSDFVRHVMLMSTNADVMRIMRRKEPHWTIGYCYHHAGAVRLPRGADFLIANTRLLDNGVIAEAVERSVPVYVGVGDRSGEAAPFMARGVNGVLGDDTRSLRRLVDRVPYGETTDVPPDHSAII